MANPTTSNYSPVSDWYDPESTTQPEPNTLPLKHSLRRLKSFLRFLGFIHDSPLSLSLSSLSFLFLGVAAPSIIIFLFYCGSSDPSACRKYHVKNFELETLLFQAAAAAVSLLCFSRSFRKYGLRIFLFVDKYQGNVAQFQFQYISKIDISSIVLVVGIIICLHAAAKISHRAQSLASFASRWHAMVTCRSNEMLGESEHGGNFNVAGSAITAMNYPESDMDSADYILPSMNLESMANVSSYRKRQAFVMYMQSNPGGVTIFGWTVNRAFMDTIFCAELTVVTFVLGKTLTFTTNHT